MPLFVYNRDIPDGPNNPSVDQPDLKVNTNSIDDLIDVDHYAFNDANGGLHKQVNLVAAGSPAILGNSVIYNALNNGTFVPWAKNSVFDVPLFSGWQNGAVLSGSGFGYSSMFAGLIVQWGFVNSPGPLFQNGDSGTVTYATVSGTENVTFPAFCLGVWTSLCTNGLPPLNTATVSIDNPGVLNTTDFTWTITTGANLAYTKFFYLAIGF